MITRSDRGTRWVVAQMTLLAALAAVAPWYRGHWTPTLSLAPATLLFIWAAWTGITGVRDLGRNLTPLPAPKPGSTLVTTGIYRRIRHPLYSSLIALGFAWALAWSSTPGLALATALALLLHAKARHEETRLCEVFPDYPAYRARVPRYLPRFR
jgi:protein-S-isoprenylcysteine O-methyltransferase Ste14